MRLGFSGNLGGPFRAVGGGQSAAKLKITGRCVIDLSVPGRRQPPGQLPSSQALSRSAMEMRHDLRQQHLQFDNFPTET